MCKAALNSRDGIKEFWKYKLFLSTDVKHFTHPSSSEMTSVTHVTSKTQHRIQFDQFVKHPSVSSIKERLQDNTILFLVILFCACKTNRRNYISQLLNKMQGLNNHGAIRKRPSSHSLMNSAHFTHKHVETNDRKTFRPKKLIQK